MPTTRRSSASARGRGHTGPTKGQSTISFSTRVTKPVPKDVKKTVVDLPAVAKAAITETPASAAKGEPTDDETADAAVVDDGPETEEPEVEKEAKEEQVPVNKSEAELEAEKITDAHIDSYWKAIEKQRKAPRIHQEDLDLSEKVLRYFDLSSQYGPCIGMPRLKRWQRAKCLGLNPPIEALAVLLKEEKKGNSDIENAQLDRVLNATALAT